MKNVVAIISIICFVASGFLPSWADDIEIGPTERTKLSPQSLTEAEKEIRVGNLFDLYVNEAFVILRNDDLTKKVTQIIEKLTRVSGRRYPEYKARIINDTLPIASSFPGYIYISTGLMDILESEDELAAVLANAIARMHEKFQYNTFNVERERRETALIASRILALGLFIGGTAIGIAAASSAAQKAGLGAYQAAQRSAQITSAITGAAVSSTLSVGKAIGTKLPEKKVTLNRLGPRLSMSLSMVNFASTSSVFTFLVEIYQGYESNEEMRVDELSIEYLQKAGYNPKAFVSILEKILIVRKNFIDNGYVSHLLIAQPGLEDRIKNVSSKIEKYK